MQQPGSARDLRVSTAALVGAGFVNLALVLGMLGVHNGFTVDEVDYLAKVVPGTPHLYWSPVRAWGTPLVAAPVAVLHPGLGLVRVYFVVLLSAGLVLAFLPWRRVIHPAVAPLAALLFATTWFATFYGNNVMPNLLVAYGCIAATGLWAALPQAARPRRAYLILALVVGGVALVRPSDSLLLAVPLVVMTLFDRRRDRKLGLLALVAGEAIGWIPWIVEAYLSFGGPLARWRLANNQVHGVHPRFVMALVYPRLFDGSPGYCCYDNPASTAGPVSVTATAWFIGILVLTVVGFATVRRRDQRWGLGACIAVAAAFILVYVGLLNYGALRFLLPIVGLLAIPVATGLVSVSVAAPRRAAAVVALGCVAIVGAHLALQVSQDLGVRSKFLEGHRVDIEYASQVKRYIPTRPCLAVGPTPQVIGYYLRCHIADTRYVNAMAKVAQAQDNGWSVIAILKGQRPRGGYAFIKQQAWVRHRLQIPGTSRPQFVYLPTT